MEDVDTRIRDLLRNVEGPEAQLVTPPAFSLPNLKRIANTFDVKILVSRDCPAGTIYALTPEDAADVPYDYAVEPD